VKRRIEEARRARVAAADDVAEGEGDPRVAAFLRGVTIGALVGAAIAGSALWERASRKRAAADAADASAAGDEPPPS
jgi:hypothetical protein